MLLFDVETFAKRDEVFLLDASAAVYPTTVRTVVAERSGTYLFIGEEYYVSSVIGGSEQKGRLAVVATGAGSLVAPTPTVILEATVRKVVEDSGASGEFLLTRTGGDLSQPLKVRYSLSGNAINGINYKQISGTKKIKAGRSSATIQVVPINTQSSPGTKRQVALSLVEGESYIVGGAKKAKIKIISQ